MFVSRNAGWTVSHFDWVEKNGSAIPLHTIPHVTTNPEEACLFVYRARTRTTWDGASEPYAATWGRAGPHAPGLNHVLIDIQDENVWADGLMSSQLGHAMLAKSHASVPGFRASFDVSFPLHPRAAVPILQPGAPRKYRATFKGSFYMPGTLGWHRELLLRLHDEGAGVIVAAACPHTQHHIRNARDQVVVGRCKAGKDAYTKYAFNDLMNTTFAFAPAGRQPLSYRLLEALRAGVIPIVISDSGDLYNLPFSNIICWSRCVVRVVAPFAVYDAGVEARHKVWLQALRQLIHTMPPEAVARRQRACLDIYTTSFSSSAAVLQSLRASIMRNIQGSLDVCVE